MSYSKYENSLEDVANLRHQRDSPAAKTKEYVLILLRNTDFTEWRIARMLDMPVSLVKRIKAEELK